MKNMFKLSPVCTKSDFNVCSAEQILHSIYDWIEKDYQDFLKKEVGENNKFFRSLPAFSRRVAFLRSSSDYPEKYIETLIAYCQKDGIEKEMETFAIICHAAIYMDIYYASPYAIGLARDHASTLIKCNPILAKLPEKDVIHILKTDRDYNDFSKTYTESYKTIISQMLTLIIQGN